MKIDLKMWEDREECVRRRRKSAVGGGKTEKERNRCDLRKYCTYIAYELLLSNC